LPAVSQADVRRQIASGRIAPLYLLIGPDEAGKTALAADFLEAVDEGLRAFNLDRLYGGETTAADVVDAARTLPMMVPKRLVLLMHAERLLAPKKENDATSKDLELLEEYVKAPVDSSCLVIVTDNLDKRRSLTRALMSKAAVVECTGPSNAAEAARWVRDRVAQEGMEIDPKAARLVAERVGPDVTRLRADVERLVLYAMGNKTITEADVLAVVGAATYHDDWGIVNAIERGAAAEALRELALLMDEGIVPYKILGQIAWFVRTRLPAARVARAVDAVFRTDLAIKTSVADPRVLLERLVVELCTR